jgi:hypothetical protein
MQSFLGVQRPTRRLYNENVNGSQGAERSDQYQPENYRV